MSRGTYVFLDLETTDHARQTIMLTKITEMSMVAVSIEDIMNTAKGQSPPNQKLTKHFNPFRLVQPGVTGLTNELLEDQKEFDRETVKVINDFLKCLKKPIYLIAHNGEEYDFPILQKYFKKLNVSLHKDILFADSLNFFRYLDNINEYPRNEYLEDIPPILKLSFIYKKYFTRIDEGLRAHEAESDCIMLMKLVVAKSEHFVKWVNKNHGKFMDVKPPQSLTRKIFGS